MLMPTLADILEPLLGKRPGGAEVTVTGVVTDSRDAFTGSLFVAIPGERVDGHAFVEAAFERGAVGALVNRAVPGDYVLVDVQSPVIPDLRPGTRYLILVEDTLVALHRAAAAWRARFDLRVIGITGSVGKTSTKELVHTVLSTRFRTFKTPGNRNSIVGLPAALFDLRPYHQEAVLEMGMYTRGEIAQLANIGRPQIGVITMIDAVHMERAGSLENIVLAKRELVEALPRDGVAVLNRDEPLVMGMADYTTANVFTYGLDPRADLWADNIESMGLNGISFTIHEGAEALHVQVPLLGRHSVHTALRAAAVGRLEGLTWDEVVSGMQSGDSELRVVTVPGPHGSVILDDTYNASPASMLAALNLLDELNGRHVAVLGDMLELGSAEQDSHELIGRRALEVAEHLVTVGPRGRIIGEAALSAGMSSARVHQAKSADEAVEILAQVIEAGDFVLVKGSRAVKMDEIVKALSRLGEPVA